MFAHLGMCKNQTHEIFTVHNNLWKFLYAVHLFVWNFTQFKQTQKFLLKNFPNYGIKGPIFLQVVYALIKGFSTVAWSLEFFFSNHRFLILVGFRIHLWIGNIPVYMKFWITILYEYSFFLQNDLLSQNNKPTKISMGKENNGVVV